MSASNNTAASSTSSEISSLSKRFSLNTIQAEAVDYVLDHDHTLLVADKGAGKTRTGLAVAASSEGRTLVLCPNKVRQGWVTEGERIGVDVALCEGEEGVRRVMLESDRQVVVLGVDLLPWFVDKYKHNHEFSGLIIDETVRFGKAGNAGSRKLRVVHKSFDWVLGLTAQPVMESPLLLYGQALAVDGGRSLGRSADRYRQQYFMQMDWQGYDWQLRPGAGAEIAEAVAGLVYYMQDRDYEASLVGLTEEVVPVTVSPRFWQVYEELCENLVYEEQDIEAVNEAVLSGKLEQLCQGALYDQMQVAHWIHFAKFDALEQMLGDDPVVVAYQYRFELEELRGRFPHGRDLKDPGAKDAFCRGELKLLFVQPRSGSHGIDGLQNHCSDLVMLKPIWSADGNDQLVGRLRRRGQTRDVRVRRLVIPGTVDEIILDRVAGKEKVGVDLITHIKEKARKV